ncbi:MAG: ribosome maturation factor RimP [Pseudomonadota bacterium]
MGSLETTLTTLITPILDELGFELVRLRLTGARTKTVQIMAERADSTMSAEDCAQLSRRVSARFEEEDPIADPYVLEVSSPGIDRPLTREKDFIRWEGHLAKLELDRMIEGRKKFRGILAGMDDGHIAFDIEGEEETALFPPAWIVQAKLLMTDDLIRESLRQAKKHSSSPDVADMADEETPRDETIETQPISANDP